uniref:Putative ATP-dependent RNA helicase TDRD12 n=1 Tax=Sphenodon punctatus TaxID=8508 RepID=A0A8D0H6S4_SPHPU
LKGCGMFADNVEYKKLHDEMNLFYKKYCRNVDEVVPVTLEEGKVCVVYCNEMKCWCRAVVKSIMSCGAPYLAECFLVDYAKYIPVVKHNICAAIEAFMRLPFKAKRFRLYCTKPVTLHIDYCNDSAEIVPARRWDSAAIQYFRKLLTDSSRIEAKLCAVEDDSFDVYLYVTINYEKVCVNDDLVAKNFACYDMMKENGASLVGDEKAQLSLSFKPPSEEKIIPVLAFWPKVLQGKVPNDSETCELLQFLNPDPLKTDIENEPQVLQKFNLELLQNQFKGPNLTESYCWPPIARGCDSVVVCPHGNDPLLYVPPILTFLQAGSCYKSLPTRNGPIVLIVCPVWKKAQIVFESLEVYSRRSRPLHPMLILIGLNKEGKYVKLQKGCEIIVTTPYSFTRLLEHHSLLFFRLCHLVLDEVEVLFSEASEHMFTILEYYKKTISVEERESAPHQIVAVGSHWSKHIEYLIKEYMNDPYVVITAMEEAAVYGNVQQVVQLCMNCERISVLLQILDFTPSNVQKTLIFTSSVEETEMVYKAVESSSTFCIRMHKEIAIHFEYVVEQWKKTFSSGTHVVLVLTDDCLPSLGITDATCVVHFSFPASPRSFGVRLHSMAENFQNCIEKGSSVEQVYAKAKSILLLTETSACHAVGVLRYLEHTEAKIPPELCDFTAGVLEAKEDMKLGRPLCHYLKIFGVCKDIRLCPDRHRVNLEIDLPRKVSSETIPTVGNITIVPLFIVDATNYFGRIVDKQNDRYAILVKEMNEYFNKTSNKVSGTVETLALYGLHEGALFYRIQVLEVFPKEENCLFCSVHIKYIDEGRTGQVQSHQLLHLPERFQSLPPQAVEFIVCRVKPIDNETEWNPRVTRYIHEKIRGKPHDAKIVLTLGETVWVDPMVQVTKLADLKTSIIEYNIRSEILSIGMGVDNPEHIENLKKLYRKAEIPLFSLRDLFVTSSEDEDGILQVVESPPPPAEDTGLIHSGLSASGPVLDSYSSHSDSSREGNELEEDSSLPQKDISNPSGSNVDACVEPGRQFPTSLA